MPRRIPFRLAAACALALFVSLAIAAGSFAKGVPVDVRVVGGGGKVLAERSVGAATTSVPTSPKATCFGKGTGGSGQPVTVKGATALGALSQAVDQDRALRPLLVTDAFDFGLAICGVGGEEVRTKSSTSWYLKVNHKAQMVGGDQVMLHAGDEVLWALAVTEAPKYTYPNELALSAPATAKAGKPFTVKVFSYDEKGKRKPVAGATVSGASGPTDAAGRATVTLAKPGKLGASREGEIPSPRVAVCVGGKCPSGSK